MYVLNSDLHEKLIEAMSWELETRRYCEKLLEFVKTDEDWENIYEVIENGRRHYSILNELYILLMDKKSETPHNRKIVLEDYAKGIEIVINNIRHTQDLYREIHLTNKSPYIRAIFSNLVEDEGSHISVFNHLHAKNTWLQHAVRK